MNDSNFSNDSYFYFQDLSTSHLVEAEPSNGFNYFNSITNSFHNQQQQQQQSQQQQLSVHHLQHVGHVPPTALHCNLNESTNNNNSSGNNNINNNNNSSNLLNNSLPFVQIHTTDVHPARSSYGNVFRRQTTNQEEIKSEPIKSESAENNTKDNANTTPTPPNASHVGGSGRSSNASNEPTSSISTNGNCSNEHLTELQDQQVMSNGNKVSNNNENNDSNLEDTDANTSLPTIYKCAQCPFISLSEAGVQQHADTSHHTSNTYFPTDNRTRMTCPGCANIFYAPNSLFVHLCEDHQMSLDEANKLLQAFEENTQLQPQSKHSVEEHAKEVQPKIFLKNVACLRDPAPRVLDEQLLQLNDGNYFQLTDFEDGCSTLLTDVGAVESDYLGLVPNVSAKDLTLDVNANLPKQHQTTTKQKISIKSVDVLREPALLRRDFEMQHLNILSAGGGMDGQCGEHELTEALEADNQYNFATNIDLEHNDAVAKELSAFEKPRRPKIYIKNVDILKEPLVLPNNLNSATGGMDFNFMSQSMQQQSSGNFLSNSDEEVATTQEQVFDGPAHLCIPNMTEPTLLYDSSSSNTFLQNISDLDSYALAQNNTNSFLLEGQKYQSELQAMSTNLEASSEPAPIVIESTPPPLTAMQEQHSIEFQAATTSQQKQKIFIKNAEILKQPQFQEHRRTLHLRTVDELNLMNKTEVENLIAPHLDALQNQEYAENNNNNSNNNNNNIDNNVNNNDNNNNLNASAENSKNSQETSSYSSLNLKINEADDAQALHNWTSGYSLGAELDCIITEHTQGIGMTSDTDLALQKQLYDLETPQMSVISVLDIEELTDEQETSTRNALTESQATQFALSAPASEQHDVIFTNSHAVDILMTTTEHLESTTVTDMQLSSEQHETSSCLSPAAMLAMPGELKHEQLSNINTSESCTPVSEKSELIYASSTTSPALSDAEVFTTTTVTETAAPLMPATHQMHSPNATMQNTLPLKQGSTVPLAQEKGRIYVADNLLIEVTADKLSDAAEHPVAVSITGGTSNRGRPFGSNRTGITKIRKLYGNAVAIDVGMKCNVQGCAFRFKKPETLDYHKRCHTSTTMSSSQAMICPECQSTNFSNWNTLHTHLWRTHQVDMELYSCELCQFKTPIYSRLINTHSKIHSEERNYKCDQCDKAFKNSKQLKNHRRWHRNAVAVATTATASLATSTNRTEATLHRCNDCGSAFSHQKTLREHMCKQSADAQKVMRCDICDRTVSSKSSLKLHMRTHEAASRFKCTACDYRANDHNAFRRHKMTHEKSKMYICPFCDYKSIQSVAYQKHLQQKHPELVDNIVHKCSECNFSTINRSLLTIHMAKHSSTEDATQALYEPRTSIDATMRFAHTSLSIDVMHHNETETSALQQQQRNKIKVKSDLVLTDPAKFSKNTNSNSVTSLLVHCFDNAIT